MTDVPPDLYYLSKYRHPQLLSAITCCSFFLVDEDFDPAHLKIAELRGILLKHDVPYTPTAKKNELVQSFKKNVASKADELLSLHRQLKPNGKGIISINTDKKAKGSSSKVSSKSVPIDEGERDDEEEGKDSDGEESSNAKARREKRAAKSASVVSHTDAPGEFTNTLC
jgi:HeH/LEM domain